MQAPGKPFEIFVEEDRVCRLYAEQSIGTSLSDAAKSNAVGSAVAGAAIGTAIGALAGEHRGAPTGAAVGLLAGTASGIEQGEYSAREMQLRYDNAYQQCMYAKGNQVSGYLIQHIPPPLPK